MKKLSEILLENRKAHNYSLEQISKDLKIKKEFLEAIEEGRYTDLPSDSYAVGFVKNYGEYLGLPEAKTMALFRRDYKVGKLDYVPSYRKKKYTRTRNFFFSLKGGTFVLVGLLILLYMGVQFRSVFSGPDLRIIEPRDGATIEGNVVEISGETEPDVTLVINGDSSYVGLDGAFSQSLDVFSGKQKIKIVARNRFGKESVSEITVNVQ